MKTSLRKSEIFHLNNKQAKQFVNKLFKSIVYSLFRLFTSVFNDEF